MAKRRAPNRVAVIQQPPVTLHRDRTLERGVELMEQAAAKGASLISFPETWIPGYPEWLWRLRPGDDYDLTSRIHRRLIENSVDLKAGDLKPLQTAARRLKVTVSVGIHERDGEYSRGTLYNTVVLIGPDGTVLNRHRKLMPTNPERMVWAAGDASGLRVVPTPMGPADFPERAKLFPDLTEWYNPGDSVVVNPGGEIVAGPLHEQHGILYAECDPAVAPAAKRTLDVAGHYGRPDIFKLEVNREVPAPVEFG